MSNEIRTRNLVAAVLAAIFLTALVVYVAVRKVNHDLRAEEDRISAPIADPVHATDENRAVSELIATMRAEAHRIEAHRMHEGR